MNPKFYKVYILAMLFAFGISQFATQGIAACNNCKKGIEVKIPHPPKPLTYPDWYTDNLVHAHTRLWLVPMIPEESRNWSRSDEFHRAGEGLKSLGANVMTRHFKTMYEDPWWPSSIPKNKDNAPELNEARKIGVTKLQSGEDIAKRLVNEAHKNGMKIIAYYWHMSDERYEKKHPEWICRDVNGKPLQQKYKRTHLDISSEYGAIVLHRLLELKQRGVDGIYLDFRHFPRFGCYGSAAEKKFLAEYPAFKKVDRKSEYYFRNFQRYLANLMVQVLHGWNKKLNPDGNFLLLTSVTNTPTLLNPHMSLNLLRAGAPKTEFSVAVRRGPNLLIDRKYPFLKPIRDETRMALGWKLQRELSKTAPHVWGNGFPNYDHALAFLSSVTSFGGVANLDVLADNILQEKRRVHGTPREDMEKIFSLGNRIGPLLKDAKPLNEVAIVFSESYRDSLLPELDQIWEKIVWPTNKIFEFLMKRSVSSTLLDVPALRETGSEKFRTLIVLRDSKNDEILKTRLEKLEESGVEIIAIDSTELYQAKRPEKYLSDRLKTTVKNSRRKISISKIHEKASNSILTNKKRKSIIVSLVNSFAWAQTSFLYKRIPKNEIRTPPEALPSGTEIRISKQFLEDMEINEPICSYDYISQKSSKIHNRLIVQNSIKQWSLVEINQCEN